MKRRQVLIAATLACCVGCGEADGIVEPPGGGPSAIPLVAERLASGSGTTVISAGVPLRPGQLQPADVGKVALFLNGLEVGSYVEELLGRYADGSVISLLVQRAHGSMTKGTPVSGYELRFGVTRSVSQATKDNAAVKDIPDGIWRLPPDHFKARVAPVWGPLLPLTEATGGLAAMDADYAFVADYRWQTLGETVTGSENDDAAMQRIEVIQSWYDQPMQRIRYFARGGDVRFMERGLRQAAVVRNYYIRVAYGNQYHRQSTLSMSAAYWWTGVASYRQTVFEMGNIWSAGVQTLPTPVYEEGRITGRLTGWALQAWLLGDTQARYSNGSRTALQQLDGVVQLSLTRQKSNGRWTSWSDTGDQGYQSNFQEAMRSYYLSLYLDYRGSGAVPGVANAINRQAAFLETQWDPTVRTWHYWDNWPTGDANVPVASMRELAGLFLLPYYFSARNGGSSTLLSTADLAADMSGTEAPGGAVFMTCAATYCLRPFTEGYYSYMYAMAKRAGL